MDFTSFRFKATVIGAGSSVFGPPNLYDFLANLSTEPTCLALVDVDEESLKLAAATGKALAKNLKSEAEIAGHQDRRDALPGSDFVLITAEEDRIDRWKLDWQIPRKFGIEHTLGENRGPGGLSHTLRTVPLVLEICQDIEELAPEAFVLILTNPEDRITYAVNRYTNLTAAGYCDGLWDFKDRYLSNLLEIPPERLFVKAAGINHAVWIKEILDQKTRQDLYPKMISKARKNRWQPLGLQLYNIYGLWPHENDEHYGEYFGYACDYIDCKGYDFEKYENRKRTWKKRQEEFVSGELADEDFLQLVKEFHWQIYGDSPPSDVAKGLFREESTFLPNANIANQGCIPELPEETVVEIPAVATPAGIEGLRIEKLPQEITDFLFRQGMIQKLSAQAAAKGSYELARKALILDDHIDSPRLAEKLLDRFLDTHSDYLPQF